MKPDQPKTHDQDLLGGYSLARIYHDAPGTPWWRPRRRRLVVELRDGKFCGQAAYYHPSSRPRLIGRYALDAAGKSIMVGRWELFHDDWKQTPAGTLEFDQVGRKHGVWSEYDAKGRLRYKASYDHGRLLGDPVAFNEAGTAVPIQQPTDLPTRARNQAKRNRRKLH